MSEVRRSKRSRPEINYTSKSTKTKASYKPLKGQPKSKKSRNSDKTIEDETEKSSAVKQNEEISSESIPETEDIVKVKSSKTKRQRSASQIGEGGIPLICGTLDWDLIGREQNERKKKSTKSDRETVEPTWVPQIISSLSTHRICKVISSCMAVHSIFVSVEGKAFVLGRNEAGQLGIGNTQKQDKAVLVAGLKNEFVINGSCGSRHSFFLTRDGNAFACGANKSGQLGIGTHNNTAHVERVKLGVELKYLSGGSNSSLFVSQAGHLYSCGSAENGQLGNNDAGESIVERKITFNTEAKPILISKFFSRDPRTKEIQYLEDVKIKQVEQGPHHCLAVSENHELFTWGFNGHHRLGHNIAGNMSTEDILVPMRVNHFPPDNILGVKSAKCTHSGMMAVCYRDFIYYWGTASSAKLPSPYPRALPEMYDWSIVDYAGGNKHFVVSAKNKYESSEISTISFGFQTRGELGQLNEENTKTMSRSVPTKMDTLEGLKVIQVAVGAGHTLLLAADDTPEYNQLLDTLDLGQC